MKFEPWVYVSLVGFEWSIFGRMREAREEVPEAAEEVCSVRMVVLWAMHAYSSGVEVEEDAIFLLVRGGLGICTRFIGLNR